MALSEDRYIAQASKSGLNTEDLYKYQPKKQIDNLAPMTSMRSFDITPTLEVDRERNAFNDLYDNILNIYSQQKTGEAIKGDSRFMVDASIAQALGKSYSEVAGNHKYYVRAITGTDMEDDGFLKAFADSYSSYWTQRKLAFKQIQFDWTNDEQERLRLLDDMEDLEQELVKKRDYNDRSFVGSAFINAAPIMNQMVESLALTYGGAVIGGAIAGVVSGTANAGSAISQIAVGLNNANKWANLASAGAKGARAGLIAGTGIGVGNTFALEAGGLSRELYGLTDEDGNRMSDKTRIIASSIGGLVNTVIEYALPDPVVGFAKIGKIPQKEVRKSFTDWVLHYGINRLTDANAESLEEGLQSFVGSVSKDIATYVSNKMGDTKYDLDTVEGAVKKALSEGVESYKDTFIPVMVSSFLPGTAKDLRTLRPSIMNGRYTEMHTKNSKQQVAESAKWQSKSENPNVISMDLINQKSAKPAQDYSVNKDGSKAEKLGKISIVEDPNNPDLYVGATAKDDDILKWAFNKGYKSVDVEILEHGSARIDSESIRNIARQNNGQYRNNIITVADENALNEMRKDLEDLGIDVAQNGNSFSFVDSDTLKNVTVQIAEKKTAQSARVVQDSNGVISNRDFVTEIKNALTADGQIDTDISDQELGVISQLAGMLGNDVTDKIEFVSAYSDSLTDKENKALAGARGATSFDSIKQSARIILSDQSDASTVVHEMFHVALEYNETARKNLTDAVRHQMKTSTRRKELETFLSEHMGELSGFESVEDAMRTLEHVANNPSKLSVKSKEALTKMFEMFNSSDSKAKENMPTGIKKVFKELADIFRKIYQNITGKTLMPERIADAYASFLNTDNSSIVNEAPANTSSEILQQKEKVRNGVKYFLDNEKTVIYGTQSEAEAFKENGKVSQKIVREKTRSERKSYPNKEIGEDIAFGKTALGELTRHDISDDAHVSSIAHVPEFIVNGKLLGDATDKEGRKFWYLLSKYSYNGDEYLVRSSIRKEGNIYYYDHKLSKIEKVKGLIDSSLGITSPGIKSNSPSTIEDKRLLAFMQGKEDLNTEKSIENSTDDILRQENLTPEQRVEEKAKRHPKSTYSQFSINDIHDMLDADVFVPDTLLEKYSSDERVGAEKNDRAVMNSFLMDNEVRKKLLEHEQINEFLEDMKKYYGSGYNSNTENVLRKIFYYNKTQTPSQMRKEFRAEYGTGNIEKLMELKAMIANRRVSKKSKNGKAYSQIYVPDTANTYNLIKNLERTSSEADIKKVTDSINSNTNMWLRDYLKATELDYSRRLIDSEVGSYDYLKAKSALMYLSIGESDFNTVKEIRNAAKVDSFSGYEMQEIRDLQKRIADFNKTIRNSDSKAERDWARIHKKEVREELNAKKDALKAEREDTKRVASELKEEGKIPPRVSPLEMQKVFYEDELAVLTDRKDEEIKTLKAEAKDRLETEKLKAWFREDELAERYDERIHKLEVEKAQVRYDFENAVKDAKRIEKYKAKWGQWITEMDLVNMYETRIERLKLSRAEAESRRKITSSLKRKLSADHNVFSADIDESLKWVYSLMHNKKEMADIDYQRYAQKTGQTTDSDVLIFTPSPDEYTYYLDGNEETAPTSYEFDPNAYNFDRTNIPQELMSYGFSEKALQELTSKDLSYGRLSIDTLVELNNALETAKIKAKAKKTAMDSVKQERRVNLASELYSAVTKADGGIPSDALSTILGRLGYSEEEYNSSTAVQSKVMHEFTANIGRYSDILENTPSRKEKFMGWTANAIGHIQWVADYIESDKNGPIHNLFVDRAQKAQNAYAKARDTRITEAVTAMQNAVSGYNVGSWSDVYKLLAKKDTVDVTFNHNEADDSYSYSNGKISYNEALGIYIYSQNWQSLGNLISGSGNNYSLETIARIAPEALKPLLETEVNNINEYNDMVADILATAYDDDNVSIPEYKSALFRDNTQKEILDVYEKLNNVEYESAIPDWVKSLGDTMIKTLSGENGEYTERLNKFAAETMNAPFIEQKNYFPKVPEGVSKVNVIGEVEGTASKRVATGSIKDRQSAFNYALRLDPVNTMIGAIEAQERLINMYDVVSDMNYIMSDKGNNFGSVVESMYGIGMKKFLNSQIADIAGNKAILSDYEKAANKILQNVAVSKIGFNAMTSVKQLLSVITASSNGEIGFSDVMNGIALTTGNNKAYAESMYNRYASDLADMSLGYEYQLLRQRREVTGSDTFFAKLQEKSMAWTNATDQAVKKWTFMGAFDKFIKSGMSEEQAGLRATEIVKKTQSIGDSYSLSNFERNRSPFVRAFAMFSKDQFQVWNSIIFGIGADINNKNYAQLAERSIGIFALSVATAALAGGWLPDEDDSGFDLEAFLSDFYQNLVGYVPLFGTFFSNDGSDSLLTEPFLKAKSAFETSAKLAAGISSGETEWSDWNKPINAVIDSLGAFGLPSVQLKRGVKTFAPNGLLGEDFAFNPGYLFGSFGAGVWDNTFGRLL